jgi:maleate isomerase
MDDRIFGSQGRLGVIVPSNNSTLEPEFWSCLPNDVAVYASRVMAKGQLTQDAVRRMTEELGRAADELAATGVDVILYGDMVTTLVMDPEWNEREIETLERRTNIPCISAWTALRDALGALNARRLAIGTPYPLSIHTLTRPFFESRGFVVVDSRTLDIPAMEEVPRVTPARLRALAADLDSRTAETFVFLATDLPTFAVIDALERDTGLAVLTSNQTLLWSALRQVGNRANVNRLGRLFAV